VRVIGGKVRGLDGKLWIFGKDKCQKATLGLPQQLEKRLPI